MNLAFPSALRQYHCLRWQKFSIFNQRRTGFRSIYKYTAFIRITHQILLSNCEFLGLRLALFFKFKRDVSIFMAKYGILINHRILEIFQCCKDQLGSVGTRKDLNQKRDHILDNFKLLRKVVYFSSLFILQPFVGVGLQIKSFLT